MGEEQFKIKPVGAGPFTVRENQLSSTLVLERNPNYFKEGLPYLDQLTFKSIGGDQPAYQALLAGQAQAYEGLSTTPLIEQAQSNERANVTTSSRRPRRTWSSSTPRPRRSTTSAAREAIYHATDFEAIAEGLFNGEYPVSQTFTGPGRAVPPRGGRRATRAYDLEQGQAARAASSAA